MIARADNVTAVCFNQWTSITWPPTVISERNYHTCQICMVIKIGKTCCCGDAHAYNNETLPFSLVLSIEIIVCLIEKFKEREECNFVRHRKNEVKRRGHLLSSNMGFILGVEANKAPGTGKYSVVSTWQISRESSHRIRWKIKLSCNCTGYI